MWLTQALGDKVGGIARIDGRLVVFAIGNFCLNTTWGLCEIAESAINSEVVAGSTTVLNSIMVWGEGG